MKEDFLILQLIDSAFPTGAFTHSFGLETAFKEMKINGPTDLFEWMRSYLIGGLANTEGIAVYISFQIIQGKLINKELPKEIQRDIQHLDQKLTLSKMAAESREGSVKIGKRYAKIVSTLYPDSGLNQYEHCIEQGLCYGNSAIVHGWISAYLGVSLDTAIFSHLYANINNQLQTALRLTAVGQTDVQMILQKLYPLIVEKTEEIIKSTPTVDDMFNHAVIQEIEQMRHERLYSRLFMS